MLAESLLKEILDPVTADLAEIGTTLVVNGVLDEEFTATARDVIDRTLDRMGRDEAAHPEPISVRYAVTSDFENIAIAAAETERHPAEPLMAAELLFNAAIPVLARSLPEEQMVKLAQVLHNEIWRRFPPGAIAYVEFILSKLAKAHGDERLAVSRELHDRVGHRLMLALQQIELAEIDPCGISAHLAVALDEIQRSLEDVQDLALALRPMVGTRSLEAALQDLVARLPPTPEVSIESSGLARTLLESVAEEVFAIIIEALRNARRHSRAAAITIRLKWDGADLVVEVDDNGQGFEAAQSSPSGLRTMSERAQVIGARLSIQSGQSGTLVRIELPLGRTTRVAS